MTLECHLLCKCIFYWVWYVLQLAYMLSFYSHLRDFIIKMLMICVENRTLNWSMHVTDGMAQLNIEGNYSGAQQRIQVWECLISCRGTRGGGARLVRSTGDRTFRTLKCSPSRRFAPCYGRFVPLPVRPSGRFAPAIIERVTECNSMKIAFQERSVFNVNQAYCVCMRIQPEMYGPNSEFSLHAHRRVRIRTTVQTAH